MVAIRYVYVLSLVLAVAAEPWLLAACAAPCLEVLAGSRLPVTPGACRASRNTSAIPAAQACLLQACSPADALDTLRFIADACAWPVRSRKAGLLALLAIQIPAVLCLGLRLYRRATQAARYAMDDYLMMAPLFVTFLVVGQYASVIAFGVDVWTIPRRAMAAGMQAFYVDEMLYLAILALIRLSMLLLYLRLFAPQPLDELCRGTASTSLPPATDSFHQRYCTVYYRRFRLAVLATAVGFVIPSTIVFFFLDAFQCRPVSTIWTRWTSSSSSSPAAASLASATSCLDVQSLAYVAASFGIVQDVAVLVLPWLPLVVLRHALFPSLRSAAAVTALAMFSLGIVVLVTSCIRLHFLVHFSPTTTTNPTWDNTDSLVWSGLEVSVSVIVACLPAVRAMAQEAYRKWCVS